MKIFDDGRFACRKCQGDQGHRKEIWALAGIRGERDRPETPRERRAREARLRERDREERDREAVLARWRRLAPAARDVVFGAWQGRAWCRSDWRDRLREESPTPLHSDPATHWRQVLTLFESDDLVWCGGLADSGKPEHSANFIPVGELLQRDRPPGPRFSGCAFREGSFSRSACNLSKVRLRLLEADALVGFGDSARVPRQPTDDFERELNRMAAVPLVWSMAKLIGFEVIGLIDTGNKSVHALIRAAEDQSAQCLMFSEFIDPDALLHLTAPLRLPGFPHEKTGELSQLLYLNTNRTTA
ncbi:MAG: hypothetical protein EBR82_44245 [Caulobacteraceae bacterium]|nr:hypothetical protein [Caulobacteraceae bacterium]